MMPGLREGSGSSSRCHQQAHIGTGSTLPAIRLFRIGCNRSKVAASTGDLSVTVESTSRLRAPSGLFALMRVMRQSMLLYRKRSQSKNASL
jgi:hypothetical protein